MKLVFTSDIHGPSPATECVLELFAQNSAQWPMILGDVLNHGPHSALPEGYAPVKVAERLSKVAHKVIAVRGNCDSEVDQMLLHSPITVSWQQVLLEKQRLFLTHGRLLGPEDLPALNQSDVLVYDHAHLPVVGQREEISYFDLGSVSISKSGNPASHGMLDNDVPSAITLNDQSIIAQITVNL